MNGSPLTPGARILVVEDESVIAEEIQERLKGMRYQVAGVADTGEQAIELATSARPDLILMDLRLKGKMDGVAAAHQIYTQLGIPSVFVTAHSDPDTIERAQSSAQFGYVLKPFEEGALQAAIEMARQRHRLERDLLASQITQAAMIQSALDAIIGTDLNGIVLNWNPAAEKLFGYADREMIGRNVALLTPDKRKQEAIAILERVRAGEAAEVPATERRRKDGSLVDVWVRTAPIRDARGNLIGAVKIARDITERKESERKLLESRTHLVASQRIGHVGSWEMSAASADDLDVAPLHWSDECFRIFGYEPGSTEIGSATFWDRVHPHDRGAVAAALREALNSSSAYEIEHRIVLPDGTERIIHERAEIIRDPETGQALKFIGTAQDVTDRKRAEVRLRDSEKRLRAIVEGMPVLLMAFDADGVPAAWNRECERVTGYSAAEIVGNPKAAEFLYPDPQERARMLEGFRVSGGSGRGQLSGLTAKDGTVKTIEWSSNSDQLPIPGWAVWSVGVDVTRRLKLEEQLRHSQKLEGLGRLAGGVAHDFNNLLAVINGYSDLILRKMPEGTPARPSLLHIRSAGQKAAGLTKQLLAFGRHQSIQLRPLDLNSLLEENQPILKGVAGEGIDLILGLGAEPSWVMADADQFHQVLMNLVVNARDAMPGCGKIVIRTANLEVKPGSASSPAEVAPGSYVMLSVSDTGTGIAPDIMDRIFDPFFTTKGGEAGTGLGLAIVYAAVKQAGGTVVVSSKPGSGATFSVILPRSEARETVRESGSPATQEQPGGETILVVEDRADVRGVVASSLHEFGYRILEAGSGEEALRQAQLFPGRIHLILTDVVMPGMTGVELAAAMRRVRPDTKALFMSGYAANLAAEGNLLEPGAAWIPKPFGPDELAAKVREVLGQPGA